MTYQSPNNTDNYTDICEIHPVYTSLWVNIVPVIQVLINIFVIAAAFNSRRRLRHNFVYIYVINTLIANALFGVTVLYTITNRTVFIERIWGSLYPYNLAYNNDATRQGLRGWWAFRSGLLVSLFLVMSGSISALIYGIRESSYFVGRRLTQRSSAKSLKVRTSPHRRTKMTIIIALNWAIPILLNIAAAVGWSCADLCICVPGYYGPDLYFCQSDVNRHCSRFLQPQRNSFLILTAVIWLVESCGMVYMLITMLRKYFNITKTRKPPSSVLTEEPATPNSYELQELSRKLKLVKPKHNETSIDDDVFKESCLSFPTLSYHVKLLLTISISFITLTLPTMILTVIDTISDEYILGYLIVTICSLLSLVYAALAPIVLVYYMPGLRVALRRIFFNCKCCTKTTLSTTASVSSGT